jgi:hypothetical protein
MGGETEGKVSVAAEGSGPAIRTWTVTRRQLDGTDITEHMQVISVADETGKAVGFNETNELLNTILEVLTDLRDLAQMQLETTEGS